MTGRWFSPVPPVSSINKTDSHDIAEILLKVALNTNKQTNHCFCIVYKGHNSYKCGLTILESNQIRCIWSIDPQLVIVVLHKNILRNILQYYLALATLF